MPSSLACNFQWNLTFPGESRVLIYAKVFSSQSCTCMRSSSTRFFSFLKQLLRCWEVLEIIFETDVYRFYWELPGVYLDQLTGPNRKSCSVTSTGVTLGSTFNDVSLVMYMFAAVLYLPISSLTTHTRAVCKMSSLLVYFCGVGSKIIVVKVLQRQQVNYLLTISYKLITLKRALSPIFLIIYCTCIWIFSSIFTSNTPRFWADRLFESNPPI